MTNAQTGTVAKPGKGNRRTGYARNRHTAPGVRRATLPWREDAEILIRVAEVGQRVVSGETTQEIAAALGVSVKTVTDDRARWRELARQAPIGALEESVDKLRLVYRSALDAFRLTASSSLNRSAYLSVARQAVMDEAKLLGQEPKQKLELEATLRNGDRDVDAEIERLLGERLARPRLVVQDEGEVAATG